MSITQAVTLPDKLGHNFVATADAQGLPHVAAAAELSSIAEDKVAVSAWFCPGTLANLNYNRLVSLIVWDEAVDIGFQLLGRVDCIGEKSVRHGYSPETEHLAPLPQVEKILEVAVNKK